MLEYKSHNNISIVVCSINVVFLCLKIYILKNIHFDFVKLLIPRKCLFMKVRRFHWGIFCFKLLFGNYETVTF